MVQFRINDQIRSPLLRLIDAEGKVIAEVARDQALILAYEQGLDLIEVDPNGRPPVVKMVDYGKFSYQEAKKAKLSRTARRAELKEIRLSATIDAHDLQTKINQARKFLDEGDKVLVAVRMRGRQVIFSEKVKDLLFEFARTLQAKFEKEPERLGKFWRAIIRR